MSAPLTLVATLTVRKEALAAFRAFETHAARVMAQHGGRIERTVVVAADDQPDTIKEVHIVTFPDAGAFAAYRNDAQLAKLDHLRARAVVHTELLVGEDGPAYRPD